jgi:hypothetical protein
MKSILLVSFFLTACGGSAFSSVEAPSDAGDPLGEDAATDDAAPDAGEVFDANTIADAWACIPFVGGGTWRCDDVPGSPWIAWAPYNYCSNVLHSATYKIEGMPCNCLIERHNTCACLLANAPADLCGGTLPLVCTDVPNGGPVVTCGGAP